MLCMLIVSFCYVGPAAEALSFLCFFFNDTATTEIYTLSLHDALPICGEHGLDAARGAEQMTGHRFGRAHRHALRVVLEAAVDRDRLRDIAERRRRAVRID